MITVLATDRLTLRRLVPADAGALLRVSGDSLVMRYWAPGPDCDEARAVARIAEIDTHWRRHGFGDYAVVTRDSRELIGFCGLHYIAGMDDVNVGYALAPSYWRRGLGGEICRCLLAAGFRVLCLPRIVAVIDPRNTISRRLAVRCGLGFWRRVDWQGNRRVVYGAERGDWERIAAYHGWRDQPAGCVGG